MVAKKGTKKPREASPSFIRAQRIAAATTQIYIPEMIAPI
jgi:hypothetical protein